MCPDLTCCHFYLVNMCSPRSSLTTNCPPARATMSEGFLGNTAINKSRNKSIKRSNSKIQKKQE